MTSPLGSLLLASQPQGGQQAETHSITQGGVCTKWDTTSYENEVMFGQTKYTNLSVVNPAAMSTGQVLLLITPAKPIILGRLFRPFVDVTDTGD